MRTRLNPVRGTPVRVLGGGGLAWCACPRRPLDRGGQGQDGQDHWRAGPPQLEARVRSCNFFLRRRNALKFQGFCG